MHLNSVCITNRQLHIKLSTKTKIWTFRSLNLFCKMWKPRFFFHQISQLRHRYTYAQAGQGKARGYVKQATNSSELLQTLSSSWQRLRLTSSERFSSFAARCHGRGEQTVPDSKIYLWESWYEDPRPPTVNLVIKNRFQEGSSGCQKVSKFNDTRLYCV